MEDGIQALRDIQHFGEEGGVVPTIDLAATSTFLNPTDMEKTFHGELPSCYLYSRHMNPTVNMFGKKLAALDGMGAALGVSSGMAAIYCALTQLMPDGGHIVSSRTVYGGTYALFKNILPKCGITVSLVDASDLDAIKAAITPQTRTVYVETMSNPLLNISDLKGISAICRARGLKLVVDNTFAPVMVTPGKWGADVVVYSCTKYISGGADLIAGAIVSSEEFIQQLIDINAGMVMLTGPAMDPRIAHELYMRLDHLPVRIQAHSRCAQALAECLSENGLKVIYPGLKTHPDHQLFKSMMNEEFGFGGMMAVDMGTQARAFELAAKLQEKKFGLYAVSLGFSRTLMSCPSVTTSSEIPDAEQKTMGLSPGLLRLSIGFTGHTPTMAQRFLECYRSL